MFNFLSKMTTRFTNWLKSKISTDRLESLVEWANDIETNPRSKMKWANKCKIAYYVVYYVGVFILALTIVTLPGIVQAFILLLYYVITLLASVAAVVYLPSAVKAFTKRELAIRTLVETGLDIEEATEKLDAAIDRIVAKSNQQDKASLIKARAFALDDFFVWVKEKLAEHKSRKQNNKSYAKDSELLFAQSLKVQACLILR